MQAFVSWDEYRPILHTFNCPCCMEVKIMPTEEELEQRITEQIDSERFAENVQRAVSDGVITINGVVIKTKGGDAD